MAGPMIWMPVFTVTIPFVTSTGKRSRPRGAGPPFFSPTRLYFDPWQPHSNHWAVVQNGTRQPRCTHFWYSATTPASMPGSTAGEYLAFFAFGTASGG